MKRIRLTKENQKEIINTACKVLQEGGLIIYPTETCYGVGVDAANPEAVQKLLSYKERPEGKAISIAVASSAMANCYVKVNETAENIYKNFLPGPITVISESLHKVAQGIEAEDGSLGVRIPDYPLILTLISQLGKPITATSANKSGKKTPYSIEDILKNISEKKKGLIDLIIDAGELPHNPPSTVVDTRMNDEKVLRAGSVSVSTHNSKVKTHNEKQKTFQTKSTEETVALGELLTQEIISHLPKYCIIFALQGELGAGKTQFAKGVGKALGITSTITSPTFTLVKEYVFQMSNVKISAFVKTSADRQMTNQIINPNNRKPNTDNRMLYHIDTWRMMEEKELMDLGFENMIKPGNVIVIEWAEKLLHLIRSLYKTFSVKIVVVKIEGKDEKRKITVQ